jgi:hypothetical protein
VDRFFDILKETFGRHQYDTGPVFSVDETGYQFYRAIACRRNRNIASLISAEKEK